MIAEYARRPFRLYAGFKNNANARRCCQSGALFIIICFLCAATAVAQTYTVLYNFDTGPNNTFRNFIAQGRDGNMYTTSDQVWSGQSGDVFKITPSGAVTELHTFDGTDGATPVGGLTLGLDGNFYGVASDGGAHGYGTIFKITPEGKLTTLYSFTNGNDGGHPAAPPILGWDGNFYGTSYGGPGNNGSVYEITPSGVFTILYSFDGVHGAWPSAPLVEVIGQTFYGTTSAGNQNLGTIFKITRTGELTVLHNFDGMHGSNPTTGLIQANNGNFYGVAGFGGVAGYGGFFGGVLFKITPGGLFTVLHQFTGWEDGRNPIQGGLMQATDGYIYGTDDYGIANDGVLFRISPSGIFSALHQFDGTHGGGEKAYLLQHTNGLLYSDTAIGGSADRGVFYSLDVGLPPSVTFLPAARPVGGTLEILGQGFNDATAVSFNGTPASFNVESDTYMTAKVPAGATTGNITVTEPSGTLHSQKQFRVIPQMFSFAPTTGPVGTSVVITGESLSQVSEVTFDCKGKASFTVDSDTQITAIVPEGAQTGNITVHTLGGIVESTVPFTVTP
jgi:uncharacterized repeat protein (TIGR03803 family)